MEDLKTEFFKQFGKQSFRGYPLEQCHSIWEFFEPHLKEGSKGAAMCRAGDFVKEAGGDWIRVLRVEGRSVYLDYDDGLNCLDVDDIIAWKHG